MCTCAYRGREVSCLMSTQAHTLTLFMLLFYGVLFYLQKFNLTFIKKPGQPCLAFQKFEKNNIHIQSQKLNGSVLKYEELVCFQNVVNFYLSQAYNAILAL